METARHDLPKRTSNAIGLESDSYVFLVAISRRSGRDLQSLAIVRVSVALLAGAKLSAIWTGTVCD